MSVRDYVRLEGMDLAVGETHNNLLCPKCRREDDKQFSITRKDEGLAYYCFRASCHEHGYVKSRNDAPEYVREFVPKPFNEQTLSLTFRQKLEIERNYSVEWPDWQITNNRMYWVIPLYDAHGKQWGIGTKLRSGVYPPKQIPKSKIYQTEEYPARLHFPRPLNGEVVHIVEDAISAERVPCSVALLGTNLTLDAVEYLVAMGVKKVRLCLDADAISVALRMLKKYALAFDVEIVTWRSNADPKDMSHWEFMQVFGPYIDEDAL